MEIKVSYEAKRGCGYRKSGGKYLVSGGLMLPCGKLPIPLDVCPTCHAGIKPSRGWTWIDADKFIEGRECDSHHCNICPLSKPMGRVGLLWIGERYYKTTNKFISEVIKMGVSRRISTVPKDFKLGETWVFLAHRKVIQLAEFEYGSAIFHAFKPTAIEYIVKGGETEQELESLIKRGFTLVKLKRLGETGELLPDEDNVKVLESDGTEDNTNAG